METQKFPGEQSIFGMEITWLKMKKAALRRSLNQTHCYEVTVLLRIFLKFNGDDFDGSILLQG
jgi:hypothetical protein